MPIFTPLLPTNTVCGASDAGSANECASPSVITLSSAAKRVVRVTSSTVFSAEEKRSP